MKWRLKGLDQNTKVHSASAIVLKNRLKTLQIAIQEYFSDESPEKLHEIRISLRRLRYSMEIFYCCIDKKIFNSFYSAVKDLQDKTGELRDLDVLISRASEYAHENARALIILIKKFTENQIKLRESLRLGLLAFVHSKEIKIFRTQLTRRSK